MADLIEKLVIQWLPEASVEFLTEKCGEFTVAIPNDKADNQQYLVRLVSRHLYSAELENSAEQGKPVWLKLFGELGTALGKGAPKQEPNPAPTVEAGAAGAAGAPGATGGGLQNVATADSSGGLRLSKLREFKISGTVDGGKEGTLQYVSLHSQVKLGEASHYTTAEIIYGVIRAIPASSSFRALLEQNLDMEMAEFIKMLRSHYKEQDSDAALMELKGCYQQPNQGAHDFCCRAIFLRDRLEAIADEEGSPWNAEKLKKRLFRTIATGLKQNSVKLELQPYLSEDSALSDREFLEKVALAEVHEEERVEKVKNKEADIAALLTQKKLDSSSSSSANAAQVAKNAKKKSSEPPEWSAEIEKYFKSVNSLTVKIDQLSSHASDTSAKIKTLENMLTHGSGQPLANTISGKPGSGGISGNNSGNSSGRVMVNGRVVFKCQNCVANNIPFCDHCFKCLESGHKKPECPN